MPRNSRKYQKLYCPHCDRSVSKSTWYTHHALYYDSGKKEWLIDHSTTLNDDFDFGNSQTDSSDSERHSDSDGVFELPDVESITDSEVSFRAYHAL